MNPSQWSDVDQYIAGHLIPSDPALDAALKASSEAGLPHINVAPNQGKLLQLFARMVNAKRILEIGTLGAYSTIWLARGLGPGGKLITLEANPKHAEVARANLARAGLSETVELRVGQGLDLLPKITGTFDLIFVDADKPNNVGYFEHAVRLSRSGSVIIVDNVIRDGKITDPQSTDASVQGTRRFYEMLAKEKRVTATAVQTVGAKGYDGFAIAIVN